MEAIRFNKCKTFWEKVDLVTETFNRIKGYDWCHVDHVAIEAALMSFRPGMSSAQTITTLVKFNGIVSFIARQVFGVDPEYIISSHARKLCGVKLQSRAKTGKDHKHQIFDHMMAHELKNVQWPKKKNGDPVDWAYDTVDAFVIARAAYMEMK